MLQHGLHVRVRAVHIRHHMLACVPFASGFHLIVCGLDSILARRWLNGMLVSLLEYDEDNQLDPSSIVPMVDGGTEGTSVCSPSILYDRKTFIEENFTLLLSNNLCVILILYLCFDIFACKDLMNKCSPNHKNTKFLPCKIFPLYLEF